MKIRCAGWDAAVTYVLTAENDTEYALLMASVDTDGALSCGDEDLEFELKLPVCND